MNIIRVGTVLAKFGQLTPAEINLEVAREIVGALGIKVNVDAPMVAALIRVLQEDDVDKLADLASHPAILPKLMATLAGTPSAPEAEDDESLGHVVCCPHCNEYHSVDFPTIEVPDPMASLH